ncbi:50S ribosomal protein L24 [Candidatus Gribaldobacteria bacterium]|nr:50S ribosomal protein L24 [Candidatus Gribaldobacteria bacterium]
MKIIKNDTILIVRGKDKGKKGKVLKVLPRENRILVANVNLKKQRKRPKKEGEKGQTIELSLPFNIVNARLICPKCNQPTRVGYQLKENKEKVRFCKKCQQTF